MFTSTCVKERTLHMYKRNNIIFITVNLIFKWKLELLTTKLAKCSCVNQVTEENV